MMGTAQPSKYYSLVLWKEVGGLPMAGIRFHAIWQE